MINENESFHLTCIYHISACCAHSYGAETWDVSKGVCSRYWQAWGQAARRLLGLPPSCLSRIIETIFDGRSGIRVVYRKVNNIIECFRTSDNEYVKFIYDNSSQDARSIIRCNKFTIANASMYEPDESPEYFAVNELLDIREGERTLGDLTSDDIDALVMLLCMR